MEKISNRQSLSINQFYSEIDEIYHQYAKKHNLSDTAFWLLYALYDEDNIFTQSELCSDWHWTPQTVNSALKNLEKLGYITLSPIAGKQKNKQILLTDLGKETAQRVIAPLMQAEQDVISSFTQKELTSFFKLNRKYIDCLWKELN